MNLRLERESCLGDWIEMQLLRDTEGLYLCGNGANNVDLGKCQNIKSLVVWECKTMKSTIRTPLPLIEYLYLQFLPELEEICDGPISPNSFEKLKKLEVVNAGLKQFWKSSSLCQKNYVPLFSNLSSIEIRLCHRIRNLGQLSIAGKDCLPQLEKLQIKRCDMMEHVFFWNDKEAGENKNRIESQQNRHVITKVFPKLKEVELRYLPNLTTFYQGIQAIEFPLLTKLQIEEYPKMKSIIIASNENINSGEITSSSAEKVSLGSSLEVLQINHNPFCGHEIPSSIFNGLEELTINEYEGSRSLFTLSVAANFVSLRKLCISKCDEMIKVIENEEQQERILLFPKLEELELKILPKLVSFCDSKCEVELPLLRNVDIKWCPNMEKFIMGLAATPKLEAFTTDLTTYVGVGVGVDVSFNNVKTLVIKGNENPLYHHKISVSLFSGLEKLEFSEYKGGMSLLLSSTVGNLDNLRVLKIQECGEIVKVIADVEEEDDVKVVSGSEIRTVLFPKLEELRFFCLHKLVSFCQWKCDVELPLLRDVWIEWCDKMEIFSLGLVAAPNLERVEINGEYIDGAKELNGAMQQYLARKEERLRLHMEWIRSMEERRMEEEEGGEEEQENMDEIEEEEDDQN